jgi:ribosome maturation factor RimP
VYRDIPDDLRRCIEPVVEHHGLELMNVESVNAPGQALLRITIDNPTGDGRVEVDRLALISREVESQLDAADTMPGAYRLEVSSPGLDRMLAREKDFAAACGSEVKLKTRRPLDGRRRFRGLLVGFDEGHARVEVDGEDVRIAFEDVEKANKVYTFSAADFSGGDSGRPAD